jgi:ABC-2 type transport system permease protein
MPVIVALCMLGYLAIRPETTQAFAFEGFFAVWAGIVIPISVGVLAGFIVHEEEVAGNFAGFLGAGVPRYQLYIGKYLLLVSCMTMCTLMATSALCIGMNLLLPAGADMKIFLSAALWMSVSALPLLALHLWVSFAWGLGASIGISFGGLLMAVIFGTTDIGKDCRQFVPRTWPVKLGLLLLVESKTGLCGACIQHGHTLHLTNSL